MSYIFYGYANSFIHAMRSAVVLVFLLISVFCLGQKPYIERSVKLDGYKGNVKSVKRYVKWIKKDIPYEIDGLLTKEGYLDTETIYDKEGLLSAVKGYSETNELSNITIYNYDEYDRLKSKLSEGFIRVNNEVVRYNYDKYDNAVLVTDSLGAYHSLGNKNVRLKKKILHLDSIGRNFLIEYMDETNSTVMHTKNSFDQYSQIVRCEFYEYGNKVSTTKMKYDSLGRNLSFKVFDEDDNLKTQGVTQWFNNGDQTYQKLNAKGKVDFDSSEIYTFDAYGNKIKEYMIDNITGSVLRIEWHIEYY